MPFHGMSGTNLTCSREETCVFVQDSGSNKEGSKGDSAIDDIKSMRRFNMIFISSIESFNELFKRSELL